MDECRANIGGYADYGAIIGGSKYCSKCSTSSEYPVNGVCKASTARANECQTPDNKGGCNVCASEYFLFDGECYETGRQPGKSVCTAAGNSGKCTTCLMAKHLIVWSAPRAQPDARSAVVAVVLRHAPSASLDTISLLISV